MLPYKLITTLAMTGVLGFTSVPALSAVSNSFNYKSVYDCQGEDKFMWYCKGELKEAPLPKEEAPEPPEEQADKDPVEEKAPETERQKALKEFDAVQVELQERLRVAYVNPTPENLESYIEYQNMVTTKAAVFTDVWKRTQWAKPELDYSVKHPISALGKATSQATVNKYKRENFESLKAEGYGVFFFYRSDCSYCHSMEAPMRIFQEQTGFEVLPISMDGVLLSEKFPGSVLDNGQSENLNVTHSPSIFLVNTKTKDIKPVASGWVSVEEIKNRVYVLTATKPGDNY